MIEIPDAWLDLFRNAWMEEIQTHPLEGDNPHFDPEREADRAGLAAVVAAIDEKYRLSDDRHLVKIAKDGWTVQHPQSCRPNLFTCLWSDPKRADTGLLFLAQEVGPWGVFVGVTAEEQRGRRTLTLGDRVDPE